MATMSKSQRSQPPVRSPGMLDTLRQRLAMSRIRLIGSISLFLLVAYFLSFPFSSNSASISSFPIFPTEEYAYPPHPHVGALKQTKPKRVAVIGAGASGSSAAWFLTRAGKVMEGRTGRQVLGEVVIFDKEGEVGGRTTTAHPHGDENLRPVELGASIFVEANRHLVKAAKRFGLKRIDPDFGERGLGIWDGKQFLFTTSTSKSWWSGWMDTAAAIRRYGPLSPYRTKAAVKILLTKFSNLYNPTWLYSQGPAASIEDFAERVGLGREYTTRVGEEWAKTAVGVNQKWMGEIWEGSTRVNYASDMNVIHAMGAAVSMATGGAMAIQGGNWQIFHEMVKESKATLRLSTEVMDIIPLNRIGEPPLFKVVTNNTSVADDDDEPFDLIFYATLWFSSPKDLGLRGLQSRLIEPMPFQKYVRLHVTYMTTTRPHPDPLFFNLDASTSIPSTILTSSITSRTASSPTPPPRFQSITWHGETYPGSGEYIVKIFSIRYLNDKFLKSVIGEEPTWILRKEWDSYPELRPTANFPPVEPVKGVQYLAALEPWVSTMETQTLSAREAVARVVDHWWGLGYGDCRGGADAWDWSCEE